MSRLLALVLAATAALLLALPLALASAAAGDGGYTGGTQTTPSGGNGGYTKTGACQEQTNGTCTDPGPTSGVTQPGQDLVVGSPSGAQVKVPGATFSTARVVSIDPTPASKLPALTVPGYTVAMVGYGWDLTVYDPANNYAIDHGGAWNPPLELTIDIPAQLASVPDSALVPAWYDATAKAWRAIADLGSRQPRALLSSERDGFFRTGSGAARSMTILTRHATPFAIFAVRKNPTTPQTVPAKVRTTLAKSLKVRKGRIVVPCTPSGTGVVACRVTVRLGAKGKGITAGKAVGTGRIGVRLSKAALARIKKAPQSAQVTLQALHADGTPAATIRRTVRLHR